MAWPDEDRVRATIEPHNADGLTRIHAPEASAALARSAGVSRSSSVQSPCSIRIISN